MSILKHIAALFRAKPAPVATRIEVHHVRAKPVDFEKRKRATTAKLISEIKDADIEARLRQAGVI